MEKQRSREFEEWRDCKEIIGSRDKLIYDCVALLDSPGLRWIPVYYLLCALISWR